MTRLFAIVSFVLVIGLAGPAQAYTVSCNDLVTLAGGTDQDRSVAVGYEVGVADFLAGLLCFVANPECQCLQNIVTTQATAFQSAINTHVTQCTEVDGTQPAFGSVSRAAKDLCPF